MEIKLSILIATMPSRYNSFMNLYTEIVKQVIAPAQFKGNINPTECLVDNSMDYNIGTKRNKLLQKAKGDYVVFVDDDDKISANYIQSILDACIDSPDCIGINGFITTNGHDKRKWFISKEFGKWFTGPDGTYYRTPNHISPVKRELALKAGFPDTHFAEDAEYSRRLLPLLKTETIISQPLYHYDYQTKK